MELFSPKSAIEFSAQGSYCEGKPTILQVLPSLKSGGVERGTVEIATAAAKHGFNSLVASSGGPLVRQLFHAGAGHITLPLETKNPYAIYHNSRLLADLIREYKVDILHARSRAPAWSAYLAARKTGCRFITTFHGIYKISGSLKKRYNAIMLKGEQIIAISEFTKSHILNSYQVEEEKLRLIPRGADLNYFNPQKVNTHRIETLIKKFHVPLDRPIILLPGRLTRWKGQRFLLEALNLLPKDSFFCLLVGDDKGHGEYRRELESYIEHSSLAGNVRITGNITDMPAAYMLADMVISASLEPEAFGRVAIEAQAMGRPIIATGIGGSCETILPGKTGWLVEPGNVQQLADTIKSVATMPLQERQAIGHNAIAHIAQHFSLENMRQKTLALYDELLIAAQEEKIAETV